LSWPRTAQALREGWPTVGVGVAAFDERATPLRLLAVGLLLLGVVLLKWSGACLNGGR
jgi:multidrug transporter EmrE-like cation transporter